MDFQFFYRCVSTSDPYQMDNSSLDKSAYPKVKNINKKSTTHFIFWHQVFFKSDNYIFLGLSFSN